MGGNALKEAGVGRVAREEFFSRINTVDILLDDYSDVDKTLKWKIPFGVTDKETFGDLDIIIATNNSGNLTKYLHHHFNSLASKSNANVTSLEWNNFQIDLIFVPHEIFEFASNFYAHDDYAACIGRVFRWYNFKLGWNGLWYTIRAGVNFRKDILLTTDWKTAMKLFGYPVLTDNSYRVQKLYETGLESPYCHRDIFRMMKPDRKHRPFQIGFFTKAAVHGSIHTRSRNYGWIILWKFSPLKCLKILLKKIALNIEHITKSTRAFFRKIRHKYIPKLLKPK